MGGLCGTNRQHISEEQKKRKPKPRKTLVNIDLIQSTFNQDFEINKKLGANFPLKFQFVTEQKTKLVRVSQFVPKDEGDQAQLETIFKGFKMSHTNLVKLLHIYQEEKGYQLVYEHSKGGRLLDVYHKSKFKSEKQIQLLMRQLLNALDYCHTNELYHGNINIDHVLCSSVDQLQVCGYLFPDPSVPVRNNLPPKPRTFFKPPEQLSDNRPPVSAATDVWSCGIVLYNLITGQSPFEGQSEKLLQQHIIKGQANYENILFEKASGPAQELIKMMLQIKPVDRISIKDALSHPFLADAKLKKPRITKLHIQNLYFQAEEGQTYDELSLAFQFAQVYYDKERELLSQLYVVLDTDNEGTLSYEELMKGFDKTFRETDIEKHVETIFQKCGKNPKKKDEITVSEFCNVMICNYRILDEKQLRRTFDLIDEVWTNILYKAKKGFLDLQDFQRVLGKFNLGKDKIKEIFSTADRNNDKQIQYKEFLGAIEKSMKFAEKMREKKKSKYIPPVEALKIQEIEVGDGNVLDTIRSGGTQKLILAVDKDPIKASSSVKSPVINRDESMTRTPPIQKLSIEVDERQAKTPPLDNERKVRTSRTELKPVKEKVKLEQQLDQPQVEKQDVVQKSSKFLTLKVDTPNSHENMKFDQSRSSGHIAHSLENTVSPNSREKPHLEKTDHSQHDPEGHGPQRTSQLQRGNQILNKTRALTRNRTLITSARNQGQ